MPHRKDKKIVRHGANSLVSEIVLRFRRRTCRIVERAKRGIFGRERPHIFLFRFEVTAGGSYLARYV